MEYVKDYIELRDMHPVSHFTLATKDVQNVRDLFLWMVSIEIQPVGNVDVVTHL
jgi:hypothetical protein